jgi:hypothetical protein
LPSASPLKEVGRMNRWEVSDLEAVDHRWGTRTCILNSSNQGGCRFERTENMVKKPTTQAMPGPIVTPPEWDKIYDDARGKNFEKQQSGSL